MILQCAYASFGGEFFVSVPVKFAKVTRVYYFTLSTISIYIYNVEIKLQISHFDCS